MLELTFEGAHELLPIGSVRTFVSRKKDYTMMIYDHFIDKNKKEFIEILVPYEEYMKHASKSKQGKING
jgi:hypothetical protein